MVWTNKKPEPGASKIEPVLAAKVAPLPIPALFPPGTSPKARSAPSKPEPRTPLDTRSSEGFVKVFVTTCARVVTAAASRQTTRVVKLIGLFCDGFIQTGGSSVVCSLFVLYNVCVLQFISTKPLSETDARKQNKIATLQSSRCC